MSVVLLLIGDSIGPAIAGIYMQTHQELAKGVGSGSFPSPSLIQPDISNCYLISVLSITLVMILRRGSLNHNKTLRKLRMEASNRGTCTKR